MNVRRKKHNAPSNVIERPMAFEELEEDVVQARLRRLELKAQASSYGNPLRTTCHDMANDVVLMVQRV